MALPSFASSIISLFQCLICSFSVMLICNKHPMKEKPFESASSICLIKFHPLAFCDIKVPFDVKSDMEAASTYRHFSMWWSSRIRDRVRKMQTGSRSSWVFSLTARGSRRACDILRPFWCSSLSWKSFCTESSFASIPQKFSQRDCPLIELKRL